MRYFRHALVALLSCAALLSCGKRDSSPAPSPVRTEMRNFQKSLPGCPTPDEPDGPCVTFRVSYPEVVAAPTPEVLTRLNGEIQARLQPKDAPRGLAAECDATFEEYRRFKAAFPTSAITYFTRRSAEVIDNSPTVLSIQFDEDEFRGGAHPNSERRFLNADPRSGADLRLAEILLPGAQAKLVPIVERRFRAERKVPEGQKLSEAGFSFPDDTFALPKAWGVTPAGVVFHWNTYEIGPRPVGSTTVLVPWPEISDLIREDVQPRKAVK
jgi:hypothetical protein